MLFRDESMAATQPQYIKLDQRGHAEKPLLAHLPDLDREVIDLTERKQTPDAAHREGSTVVVIPPVAHERLKGINA